MVRRWNLMTFPVRTRGAIEMMIENCNMPAMMVQDSLRFGRPLKKIMRTAQTTGHKMANRGLEDSITVMEPFPVQSLN
jgi:hypothetical protein